MKKRLLLLILLNAITKSLLGQTCQGNACSVVSATANTNYPYGWHFKNSSQRKVTVSVRLFSMGGCSTPTNFDIQPGQTYGWGIARQTFCNPFTATFSGPDPQQRTSPPQVVNSPQTNPKPIGYNSPVEDLPKSKPVVKEPPAIKVRYKNVSGKRLYLYYVLSDPNDVFDFCTMRKGGNGYNDGDECFIMIPYGKVLTWYFYTTTICDRTYLIDNGSDYNKGDGNNTDLHSIL